MSNDISLKNLLRPSLNTIDEGLSFSDYFDDSVPYDVKPVPCLTPMEEADYPIQAKDLFKGIWEEKGNSTIFIDGMTPDKKEEFKLLLAQLFKHLQDELKLKTVPTVSLLEDSTNANKILGKTGYYNPAEKKIVLYITGRHPKDILRSFAHEVIHHWQHEHDKLEQGASESSHDPKYAQNNPWLRQMEKQAYLLGNIMFRDWEDEKKAQDRASQKKLAESIRLKKKALNEGPEDLLGYTYDDDECVGPFIIFKHNGKTSYIIGHRDENVIHLNGNEVYSQYDDIPAETHGVLESALTANVDIDKRDLTHTNSIYGRVWNIDGVVYVSFWNTVKQIKAFGSKSILEKMLSREITNELKTVRFNPFPSGDESEDETYTYQEFFELDGGTDNLEKQKKQIALHLLDPSLKGKLMKQMGMYGKTRTGEPDFIKRQLAGVDEDV